MGMFLTAVVIKMCLTNAHGLRVTWRVSHLGAQGVRALVLLKELMVPGPLGCAQPPGSRMVTVKTQVGLTGSRRQRGLKG